MTRLIAATHNRGKLHEISTALAPHGIDVVGIDALEDTTEVDETGTTFEENARLKAEQYSLRCSCAVLADDSGLEVDALDGGPGVHSARYGGPELSDPDRNLKLLGELRELPDAKRSARFRCLLAVARAGRTLATFEGVVEGTITDEPRGEHGFGYDPVFFHEASGCTTAELTTEQKQRISHRGRALEALLEAIRNGDPRLADLG